MKDIEEIMWGAIIGDLAGSIYEFNQTKKVFTINTDLIIEDNSFYSDDSILTIAILDAILNDRDYGKYLKQYGINYSNYKPDFTPYFNNVFSPGFSNWVNGDNNGKSIGNGAMMRISPIGYLFNSEEEVIKEATLATIPSHNTEEAIECAKLVALIIFYSRKCLTKEEIIKKLNINLKYKAFNSFNYTCNETIDNCLYALFASSSFEESVRKVISYGGDTDTNACIVGSMAEAMFGIEENLVDEARKRIPKEFVEILEKAYSNVSNIL